MSTQLKNALLGLVLVGIGAGAAWVLKPGPATPAVSASAAAGGVGLPQGATAVAAAEPASAVEAPAMPTWTAMVNPQAGPAGDFVIKTPDDTAKALRMAEDAIGEPTARKQLALSTWRIVMSGAQQRTATVQYDASHGVVLRDDESGDELGWVDGTCWIGRQEVTVPCMRPTASLMRAIHWALRGASVSGIGEVPWQIVRAASGLENDKLHNIITFDTGGAAHASTGMFAVLLDPVGRRLTGLDVSSTRQTKDSAASLLSRAHIEYDDPRKVANWNLASTLRIRLIDQVTDDVVVRIVDVRAGAQLPKAAKAVTLPKGMQLGARPGGLALQFAAASHDQFVPAINKATALLASPLRQVQFDVVEAFAPLGQDRNQGIDLLLIPRSQVLMAAPGLQPHTKPFPAELAVVRSWQQLLYAEVPAAVAAFLLQAEQAGHKAAGERRTTVTYLFNEEGDSPKVIVELALPIAPPDK